VFILATGLILVPVVSSGTQVAVASSINPSHAHNAIATIQLLGGTKLFSDISTLVPVPQTGNDTPHVQSRVDLAWKASASAGAKYNVYRSGRRGECLKSKSDDCKKINLSPFTGTNYTDRTVQAGQTYFYVTKAVSSTGKESGPSNETQAVVGLPKR
jgi:hypothetical protein